MVMTRASEEGLVRAAGGRLETLYELHGHDLKRLAYLMTGNMALAEDLTQDAFIRAAGRLGHLRDPDRFPAYLRKTLVNMVRDHFRRKTPTPAQHGSGGSRDLDAEHDLRIALTALPYRQRAAIVFRYYADLPDEETADILGCRRATVRSLIARGLSELKIRMEVSGNE